MRRLLVIPIVAVLALVVGATYGLTIGNDRSDTQIASNVPSEGIDVHGDWKIAIYNEDGSLDHEYAFSNALRPGAGTLLGTLLGEGLGSTGDRQVNSWFVVFGDATTPRVSPCSWPLTDPPNSSPDLQEGCILYSPGGISDTPSDGFQPLSVASIDGGLSLSGSVTATQAGNVDRVETWLYLDCAECSASGIVGDAFTGADVGPFEDIQAGQIIQIEVEITFATPAP